MKEGWPFTGREKEHGVEVTASAVTQSYGIHGELFGEHVAIQSRSEGAGGENWVLFRTKCALLTLTLSSVFLKENGRYFFPLGEKWHFLVLSSLVLESGEL